MEQKVDTKPLPTKIITRRDNKTIRVKTLFTEPSMTDQQFAEDCDINFIMKKFNKTGVITHGAKRPGIYADTSEIPTGLLEANIKLQEVQENFMQLDAETRFEFNNNPQEMINFLQDPKNHEKAVELGLMQRRPQKDLKSNEPNDQNQVKKQATQQKKPNTASSSENNSGGSADE